MVPRTWVGGWSLSIGAGKQSFDGGAQLGQVVAHRRGENGVAGVEVAVGQLVAHAGDLAPGQARLRGGEVGRQVLGRFADLDEPDPDRVEDQPVGKRIAGRPSS